MPLRSPRGVSRCNRHELSEHASGAVCRPFRSSSHGTVLARVEALIAADESARTGSSISAPPTRSIRAGLSCGMVEIELLYFDGCPSWERAWSDLGRVLAETGISAAVRVRDVLAEGRGPPDGFAGSPSVLVNGVDLEGVEGVSVIACRRYAENEGRGWPSTRSLRDRIVAASGETASTVDGSGGR